MKRFVEGVDRSQSTLFPEQLEDWIGADNPVRVIDVFVDELDLGELGFERIEPLATGRPLKRLRNIASNPAVALVADRYDDGDWSRLGWVMVRGRAEVLHRGPEHAEAQRRLRARYAQMAAMSLESLPVIAIRIERVASWGDLRVTER